MCRINNILYPKTGRLEDIKQDIFIIIIIDKGINTVFVKDVNKNFFYQIDLSNPEKPLVAEFDKDKGVFIQMTTLLQKKYLKISKEYKLCQKNHPIPSIFDFSSFLSKSLKSNILTGKGKSIKEEVTNASPLSSIWISVLSS